MYVLFTFLIFPYFAFVEAASAQAIVTGVEGPKRHLLEQEFFLAQPNEQAVA